MATTSFFELLQNYSELDSKNFAFLLPISICCQNSVANPKTKTIPMANMVSRFFCENFLFLKSIRDFKNKNNPKKNKTTAR